MRFFCSFFDLFWFYDVNLMDGMKKFNVKVLLKNVGVLIMMGMNVLGLE